MGPDHADDRSLPHPRLAQSNLVFHYADLGDASGGLYAPGFGSFISEAIFDLGEKPGIPQRQRLSPLA
jgi:hypothetical protein